MNSVNTPVQFGGLAGRLHYDDAAFEVDDDIQRMFYGLDRDFIIDSTT